MATVLRILYLGPISGTCLDRANALRRMGHKLDHVNPRHLLHETKWIDRAIWRLGGNLFSNWVKRALKAWLGTKQFDLCYVDGGELITAPVIKLLRDHAPVIINYNIDDPLGSRDGPRYKAYRNSLGLYDLVIVMRSSNVAEAKALGAHKVLRVFMAADEVSHKPRTLTAQDLQQWSSEVLFLGTWMPERGPFLLELIKRKVPLTIRGPHWEKSPEWPLLKHHWAGGAISGDDYAKAIQCAKVNLGLLSLGNRDEHTTRSLEIPALNSLLCAQRTPEHLAMYTEGKEALFWSDANECANACAYALNDEKRRQDIANAGYQKVKLNGHYNEMQLAKILAETGLTQ